MLNTTTTKQDASLKNAQNLRLGEKSQATKISKITLGRNVTRKTDNGCSITGAFTQIVANLGNYVNKIKINNLLLKGLAATQLSNQVDGRCLKFNISNSVQRDSCYNGLSGKNGYLCSSLMTEDAVLCNATGATGCRKAQDDCTDCNPCEEVDAGICGGAGLSQGSRTMRQKRDGAIKNFKLARSSDEADIELNPGPTVNGGDDRQVIKVHPAFVPHITNDVSAIGGVSVMPSQLPYCTPLGDIAEANYAPSFVNQSLREQQRLWDVKWFGQTGKCDDGFNEKGVLVAERSVVVEEHKRDKNYNLHKMPYQVCLTTVNKPWVVKTGELVTSNSFPPWAGQFQVLQDLSVPTRDKKYMIPNITSQRYVDEMTMTTEWHALSKVAQQGSTYLRFYVKLWLDFFTQSIKLNLTKSGQPFVEEGEGHLCDWRMASSHRTNQMRAEPYYQAPDLHTIVSELGEIYDGNVFLFSNDYESVSRNHAGFVHRYASSWPQKIVKVNGQMLSTCNLNIGGASRVIELVGGTLNVAHPSIINSAHPYQIMAFAQQFAMSTNSSGDLMAGYEIAASFGFQSGVGRFGNYPAYGVGTDAFWSNGQLRLPIDMTMPAFFQPFTDKPLLGKAALQLVSLQVDDVFKMALSLHLWYSVATQITFHGNNLTKETLVVGGRDDGGMASKIIDDMIGLTHGRFTANQLMLAFSGTSLWMYGFRPRTSTLRCVRHERELIADGTVLSALFNEMTLPMLWTGAEVLEVCVHMPDSHVWPLPDHVIKQQAEGGLSWGTKVEDRNHVRLSRTLPVIRDYPWLQDGGIDYSMRYYLMDLKGKRTFWHKPSVATRPKDTPDLPVLMANEMGWGTLKFRLPYIGQCPSFDNLENEQLSWMFEWDEPDNYEWARMITHQQPNTTTTFKFRFPSGSNCYDENSIIRLFPELMADIMQAYAPEIDMTVVYNASFGVSGDKQLGPSAPGNDPRFDAAFRWIKVGRSGNSRAESGDQQGIPRHMRDQKSISKRGWKENRYASLPIDKDVREEVADAAQSAGSSTESSKLHSAGVGVKMHPQQKARLEKETVSDDQLLDRAIDQANAERAERGPVPNIGNGEDNTNRDKVSYAKKAADNIADHPNFSVEGRHDEKLKSAVRQGDIARIAKQGEQGIERELDLPIKYKTDNDDTLALQEELLRRKQGHKALN